MTWCHRPPQPSMGLTQIEPKQTFVPTENQWMAQTKLVSSSCKKLFTRSGNDAPLIRQSQVFVEPCHRGHLGIHICPTQWRATLGDTVYAKNCTETNMKRWRKYSRRNSVEERVNWPSMSPGWLHRKDKAEDTLSEALRYSSSHFKSHL